MHTLRESTDYFGISIPFMAFIGLRPEVLEDDYCRTSLSLRPELTNSRGDVHGGTLMSVLDFTMSAAARSRIENVIGVATIEMSTHFMLPATGDIIIEARCLRRGRSTVFCEGAVLDAESGKQVVVGRGTFKLISRRGPD